MKRSHTLRLASLALPAALLGGCSADQSESSSSPSASAPSLQILEGDWNMDLSPAHDGTNVKTLKILPDPAPSPGAPATFTGTVYSGVPFDNGLATYAGGRITFSFVSDLRAEQGGPYYWLGSLDGPRTLRGSVRSLSRSLEMNWVATRTGPDMPPPKFPSNPPSPGHF